MKKISLFFCISNCLFYINNAYAYKVSIQVEKAPNVIRQNENSYVGLKIYHNCKKPNAFEFCTGLYVKFLST